MSFKNLSKYLVMLFIMGITFIFHPLHCNAAEYSSIPYMKVRLCYGTNMDGYGAHIAYKDQKVMFNFKNDGSPATIDLRPDGSYDSKMSEKGINYVGGEYYVGNYSDSKCLIQNRFKDCVVDDMSDYISFDSKKTDIKILPKDAETWTAIENDLGLTEDNYSSRIINIYLKNKVYTLKPTNNVDSIDSLNNPKILTATRKSEKIHSSDTVIDIPAIQYVTNNIYYYHTLRREEYEAYEILSESLLTMFWSKYNERNITDYAKYLEKPVNVSDYVSNAFYCPGYEVDGLYVKDGSGNYEKLSVDDTYNSNKEIYPHWVRKKGKSSLQVFSSQSIKDIERNRVVRISDEKVEEIITLLKNTLDNEISDYKTLSQIIDSTSDLYSKVSNYELRSKLYDKNSIIKNYLENKANTKGELYTLDDVFDTIDDMIDISEEILELPKYDENDTSHRYYPNSYGTGGLYEIEFDTSEGVEFGKDIPLLDMSLTSR